MHHAHFFYEKQQLRFNLKKNANFDDFWRLSEQRRNVFCLAGEFSIRNTIRSLPLIQFRVAKTA